eukprot:794445_1
MSFHDLSPEELSLKIASVGKEISDFLPSQHTERDAARKEHTQLRAEQSARNRARAARIVEERAKARAEAKEKKQPQQVEVQTAAVVTPLPVENKSIAKVVRFEDDSDSDSDSDDGSMPIDLMDQKKTIPLAVNVVAHAVAPSSAKLPISEPVASRKRAAAAFSEARVPSQPQRQRQRRVQNRGDNKDSTDFY